MSYNQRFAILQRMRPDIAYALTKFSTGTRNYLVVSTVFGFIVALLDTGALWLMGIPLPILWRLLSFITNHIPNIGFVLGLISSALLGLLEGGPWLLLWVIVGYTGRREVTEAPDAERKATAKFLAIFRSTLTLDGKDRSCHRNML